MKNMKKLLAVLLCLAMVLSLAACGSSTSGSAEAAASGEAAGSAEAAPAENAGAAIKLGGIGPTTGAAAIYGTATMNGAQIAVDEINALGGIQFELNWQDDEHDPEKSVNAYNNLKDWGMQMLVGCTTTGPCVAVSPESNADRIFQLTPSASSVDVIGGQTDGIARKDNVFQMCFTDPNQGTASAQYIKDQNLGTKIAITYNNGDAYSTGIYNKFISEAETLGLEVVSTTTFTDDSANDFSVQLGDAKNAGADLLFLPIYYQPASLILAQAKDMDYAPKFFGVDGMDGILTLEGFDTSLAEGVMLLTPFSPDASDEKTQNFVKTYQEKYGDVPNQFAADAYDCVYAIYNAVQANGVTADMSAADICEKMIATFTGDFTFDGITGTGVTWSDSGEVSKAPKGMVIQNGVYVGM